MGLELPRLHRANVRIHMPNVRIDVYHQAINRDGWVLVDSQLVENLVVDSGLNALVDLVGYPALGGNGFTPQACAVGTSAAATAASNAALGAEVYRSGVTRRTAISKGLTFQFVLPTTAANGNALAEIGIFTGLDTATVMWSRATYNVINKTNLIQVVYSWDWLFSAS